MGKGRIKDCIEDIKDLDLQGVFSMSTDNVPGAFSLCEQLISDWMASGWTWGGFMAHFVSPKRTLNVPRKLQPLHGDV